MLQQSFKSLTKALPTVLGIGGGLGGLLTDKDESTPPTRPACFPARKSKSDSEEARKVDDKEE